MHQAGRGRQCELRLLEHRAPTRTLAASTHRFQELSELHFAVLAVSLLVHNELHRSYETLLPLIQCKAHGIKQTGLVKHVQELLHAHEAPLTRQRKPA